MYSKALNHLNNVTISDYSPRNIGETEARSDWKEIKSLPFGIQNRISLIETLSGEYSKVHLRLATRGHRARIFVQA